jgi:hypothetical protein
VKLDVSMGHESPHFEVTNVTIEQLETYVPSSSTNWSRAEIYKNFIVGERWEMGEVFVNENLDGTVVRRQGGED